MMLTEGQILHTITKMMEESPEKISANREKFLETTSILNKLLQVINLAKLSGSTRLKLTELVNEIFKIKEFYTQVNLRNFIATLYKCGSLTDHQKFEAAQINVFLKELLQNDQFKEHVRYLCLHNEDYRKILMNNEIILRTLLEHSLFEYSGDDLSVFSPKCRTLYLKYHLDMSH